MTYTRRETTTARVEFLVPVAGLGASWSAVEAAVRAAYTELGFPTDGENHVFVRAEAGHVVVFYERQVERTYETAAQEPLTPTRRPPDP